MEWSLVFLDVGWDATSVLDFANVSFAVVEHPYVHPTTQRESE
jgi:hypothetical protein